MPIDRALDPAERFFWLSDRVSCMNFVVFAELDGVVDARALRAALDRAQRRHPLLRVRIATDGDTPRFATDAQARIPLEERGKRLRSMLPNVSLSNIGRVEAIEAADRVRSISFALCPLPFQLAFCAASTYAGRLLINLTYDATKLSPRDAARMTADLRERLAAEAGT